MGRNASIRRTQWCALGRRYVVVDCHSSCRSSGGSERYHGHCPWRDPVCYDDHNILCRYFVPGHASVLCAETSSSSVATSFRQHASSATMRDSLELRGHGRTVSRTESCVALLDGSFSGDARFQHPHDRLDRIVVCNSTFDVEGGYVAVARSNRAFHVRRGYAVGNL